jgi:hypothetical protein
VLIYPENNNNKYKTDINIQDSNGDTVLHNAVKNKEQCLIKFLLKANASITITNNEGKTALACISSRIFNDKQLITDIFLEIASKQTEQEKLAISTLQNHNQYHQRYHNQLLSCIKKFNLQEFQKIKFNELTIEQLTLGRRLIDRMKDAITKEFEMCQKNRKTSDPNYVEDRFDSGYALEWNNTAWIYQYIYRINDHQWANYISDKVKSFDGLYTVFQSNIKITGDIGEWVKIKISEDNQEYKIYSISDMTSKINSQFINLINILLSMKKILISNGAKPKYKTYLGIFTYLVYPEDKETLYELRHKKISPVEERPLIPSDSKKEN